ncbi:MAG: polysaccharide export protein [Planctomycetaceae bacterium]|nr:polysaccharide export protein [Planctomycetaceae bacterium]
MLIPVTDRDRSHWIEGNFVRRSAIWTIICGLNLMACGCSSIFSRPVMSAAPQSLQWFSNLAAAPVEPNQTFDLTLIQPVSSSGILPNEMLEITIWDLYEPGKPHTFPARVGIDGKINLPHLESVSVAGISAGEMEARLNASYRERDVLKQPRILVRELPSAPLHVYVTGSVLRPGLINLPRRNASVFAALVSAGGLSRHAGMHVFVSDQSAVKPVESTQSATAVAPVETPKELPLVAGNAGLQLATEDASAPPVQSAIGRKAKPVRPTAPVVRFQSEPPPQSATDLDLTEPPAGGFSAADVPLTGERTGSSQRSNQSGVEESIATRPTQTPVDNQQNRPGHWFDLSAERDREQLKSLILRDGDVITVRAAAQPVRITGAVAQPGPYRTPASNTLTLVEAVELAGGLSVRDKPVAVILTRPASAERGLQRWTFHMGDGQVISSNAPFVQPGDIIHVEPTAKARVQSIVDAFRPSKW